MYRSAVVEKPVKSIEDWQDFLRNGFPNEMLNLDISKRSPDSHPEITSYPKSITDHARRFSKALEDWLVK
jgi:hypothetical protein